MALAKPPGIHSAIVKDSQNDSIAARLLKGYPKLKDVALKEEDAGLINRLDYETSGILIVAKNREVWRLLRQLSNEDLIIKSYLAIVEGKTPLNRSIQAFIGSPYRGAKKVRVFASKPQKRMRAQAALTKFKRLTYDKTRNLTLVHATITSGSRHQIRAHAAFMKHPLWGDVLYGGSALDKQISEESGCKFFLHAERVEFKHPVTGKRLEIVAPLPGGWPL